MVSFVSIGKSSRQFNIYDDVISPHHTGHPPLPTCSRISNLVVRLAVKNSKNGKEKVDNIQVETDGGRDLLFDMMLPHNHLSINKNVGTKDERAETSVNEFTGGAIGEKHGHEAKDDKTPQRAEKIWHP